MSGSLTRGGWENVTGIPGVCMILRIWQEAHGITLLHFSQLKHLLDDWWLVYWWLITNYSMDTFILDASIVIKYNPKTKRKKLICAIIYILDKLQFWGDKYFQGINRRKIGSNIKPHSHFCIASNTRSDIHLYRYPRHMALTVVILGYRPSMSNGTTRGNSLMEEVRET